MTPLSLLSQNQLPSKMPPTRVSPRRNSSFNSPQPLPTTSSKPSLASLANRPAGSTHTIREPHTSLLRRRRSSNGGGSSANGPLSLASPTLLKRKPDAFPEWVAHFTSAYQGVLTSRANAAAASKKAGEEIAKIFHKSMKKRLSQSSASYGSKPSGSSKRSAPHPSHTHSHTHSPPPNDVSESTSDEAALKLLKKACVELVFRHTLHCVKNCKALSEKSFVNNVTFLFGVLYTVDSYLEANEQLAVLLSEGIRMIEMLWDRLISQVFAADKIIRISILKVIALLVRFKSSYRFKLREALENKHTELFLQLCLSDDKDIRRLCVECLEGFHDIRVLTSLISSLEDDYPLVRRATICSLPVDLEGYSSEILENLAARSYDYSEDVRSSLYEKLSHYPPETLSLTMRNCLLFDGLSDASQGVKGACTNMLKAWLQASGGLEKFLEEMLQFGAENECVLELCVMAAMSSKQRRALMSKKHDLKTLTPAQLMILRVVLDEEENEPDMESIGLFLKDIISEIENLMQLAIGIDELRNSPEYEAQRITNPDQPRMYDYSSEDVVNFQKLLSLANSIRQWLLICHKQRLVEEEDVSKLLKVCITLLRHGPISDAIEMLMFRNISPYEQRAASSSGWPAYWITRTCVNACVALVRKLQFISAVSSTQAENSFTRIIVETVIAEIRHPLDDSAAGEVGPSSMSSQKDLSAYPMDEVEIEFADVRKQLIAENRKHDALLQLRSKLSSQNVRSSMEAARLEKEIESTMKVLEECNAVFTVLRNALVQRWMRILVILDSFLTLTNADTMSDPIIADLPRAQLVPAMDFFHVIRPADDDQNLGYEYCLMVVTKCLASWYILSNPGQQLDSRFESFIAWLQRPFASVQKLLQQLSSVTEDASGYDENAFLMKMWNLEIDVLWIDLHLNILGDLMIVHPLVRTSEAAGKTMDHLWRIATGREFTCKYLQSATIRIVSKLLIADENMSKENDVKSEEYSVLANRLRSLMELAFLAPTLTFRQCNRSRTLSSESIHGISAKDKLLVMGTLIAYATKSSWTAQMLFTALGDVLTKSIYHTFESEDMSITEGVTALVRFCLTQLKKRSEPKDLGDKLYPLIMKLVLVLVFDVGRAKIPGTKGGFDASSLATVAVEAAQYFVHEDVLLKGSSVLKELGKHDHDLMIRQAKNLRLLFGFCLSNQKAWFTASMAALKEVYAKVNELLQSLLNESADADEAMDLIDLPADDTHNRQVMKLLYRDYCYSMDRLCVSMLKDLNNEEEINVKQLRNRSITMHPYSMFEYKIKEDEDGDITDDAGENPLEDDKIKERKIVEEEDEEEDATKLSKTAFLNEKSSYLKESSRRKRGSGKDLMMKIEAEEDDDDEEEEEEEGEKSSSGGRGGRRETAKRKLSSEDEEVEKSPYRGRRGRRKKASSKSYNKDEDYEVYEEDIWDIQSDDEDIPVRRKSPLKTSKQNNSRVRFAENRRNEGRRESNAII